MKILVIGGYGNFGRRLVQSLLEHYDHKIVIAGRSIKKAENLASELSLKFNSIVKSAYIDVLSNDLNNILYIVKPDLVVNASGSFHFQSNHKNRINLKSYQVAKACLLAKCHYLDFADNREYVFNFEDTFDEKAKKLGLVFVSGASTVPGLTDAVIQHYLPEFSELTSINYGISPGNKTERGKGTVTSILSYTGKPFNTLKNGQFESIYGWQNLSLYDFGSPIGKRWMSNCDIPDLELLPVKYPELKSVKFQAGLEVSILHLGLWFLSLLSRIGWVKNWSPYANPITIMSEWFSSLGSDCGGMFVILEGVGLDNSDKKINWQLVAEDGLGPNIPTIPIEILIQKLSNYELESGAKSCLGMFSLDEFFAIADRWNIYQREACDD